MTENNRFERITIEPATNGYIVTVDTENNELKYVYSSLRTATRALRDLMKDHSSDDLEP